MTTIITTNPYSGEKIGQYEEYNDTLVTEIISSVRSAQSTWKRDLEDRLEYFKNILKPNLSRKREELARLMTTEMGKPISQSLSEIDKCLNLLDYAVKNYPAFLEPEPVKTEGIKTYVRFDPLGTVLLVMPWNFPLWQVMRAAVPAMLAGNGIILKHASIVTGSSLLIEEIFENEAFRSVILSGSRVSSIIPKVDGVSLTGSTSAGKSVAQEAGKHLKKVVLELGGSDPFIVLRSADLNEAAEKAVFARLQNNGQSCIASKRFIVHEDVMDEFVEKISRRFSSVKIGDPLDRDTFLGPLSSSGQTNTVVSQVQDLSKIGRIRKFGEEHGGIVPPTIALLDGKYEEEVFGPVAIVSKFDNSEEAIRLANDTPYGLGSSIWGSYEEAEELIPHIEAGMVYVNKVVASDPRVPFGGVKQSGIGRELSKFGLREFTNVKTVWIDH
ncbi:MAG: aldehyde dehydrogenase family protein [Candidatus Thermoplasmatota archaeon]|nr:aldehyde dehydrogenase family protein [Candidatus Thermoplasmatota archaeon]